MFFFAGLLTKCIKFYLFRIINHFSIICNIHYSLILKILNNNTKYYIGSVPMWYNNLVSTLKTKFITKSNSPEEPVHLHILYL